MAQKPKTKRPASARSKSGAKSKAAKKTSLARRNYEYDHQYGLSPRKS